MLNICGAAPQKTMRKLAINLEKERFSSNYFVNMRDVDF